MAKCRSMAFGMTLQPGQGGDIGPMGSAAQKNTVMPEGSPLPNSLRIAATSQTLRNIHDFEIETRCD
ncbi:hypothetical protein [Azospirillum halopraeferens]|uniref:hypothetical protein n=1 Tax=Azospirillum halopraeferens TaxID=34010 RepID=UPI0012EC1010|nr:hypothetical protein [Azospirillum halopraeferens]